MNAAPRWESRIWLRFFAAAPYVLFACLAIIEYRAILQACNGKFIYSLDDPYIHLTLAERIARGTYGVNLGEPASPSSSVIWPLLLVPFSTMSQFDLAPLALNLLISAATIVVYTKFANIALHHVPRLLASAASAWIALLLLLATNLVGLLFTGMEHSLQVFLCASVVLGLALTQRDGKPPRWLAAVLAVAPWVRYECMAVLVPAAALLALRGHWKTAVAGLAGGLLGLASFSYFLHSLGLAWLPASVIAKSGLVSPEGSLGTFLPSLKAHIDHNLAIERGSLLAFSSIGLALVAIFFRGKRLFALFGILASWLHLAAGQFGWWDRYEVYIITTVLLVWLALSGPILTLLFRRLPSVLVLAVLVVPALPTAVPYAKNFLRTPIAAANIYEQQYQMHRFTVDYLRAPVAVNDLGWVAYRNPYYVLDLWGLGSLETLRLRSRSPGDPGWMDAAARKRGIRLAMVYDTWFGRVPPTWIQVAKLRLGKPQASAGGDTVTFYVLELDQVQPVKALLAAFESTLPPGVPLELAP